MRLAMGSHSGARNFIILKQSQYRAAGQYQILQKMKSFLFWFMQFFLFFNGATFIRTKNMRYNVLLKSSKREPCVIQKPCTAFSFFHFYTARIINPVSECQIHYHLFLKCKFYKLQQGHICSNFIVQCTYFTIDSQ